MTDKTFRVLSIDGGGVRGVFAAKMLELIETKLGIDIRNTFDLIVGTSTGSIIAAAITIEYGLTQLVDDYVKNAPEIFRKRLSLHFRSKYDLTPLENFLHDRLGDVQLDDVPILVEIVEAPM